MKEYEGIGKGHTHKEVHNVFIKLSALQLSCIIPTKLVTPVNSPHMDVVVSNSDGAWDRTSGAIFLSSEDCSELSRIISTVHGSDYLVVHPGKRCYFICLHCCNLSPGKKKNI